MDNVIKELNNLLVDTFRDILRIEQRAMEKKGKMPLSIGEVHAIESIAKSDGCTIGDIARDLGLTLATVTATVDRIERKGYVTRQRSEEDRRLVRVFLTDTGRAVDKTHRWFHERMTRGVLEGFTREETEALLSGIRKLNDFFKKSAEINLKSGE